MMIMISTLSNPIMFGSVGFVSKSRLQKDIGKWDSHYSFSSYRPFFKPEVTHLSPISHFRLEKVYTTEEKTEEYCQQKKIMTLLGCFPDLFWRDVIISQDANCSVRCRAAKRDVTGNMKAKAPSHWLPRQFVFFSSSVKYSVYYYNLYNK